MNRCSTASVLLVTLVLGMTLSSAAGAERTHLRAQLSSDSARGPGPGHARYKGATDEERRPGVGQRGAGRKLRVRVRVLAEGVADGTVVAVIACGPTKVGDITLRVRGKRARGRMKLMSKKGDAVPACAVGDGISITTGNGVVALSGTFLEVIDD